MPQVGGGGVSLQQGKIHRPRKQFFFQLCRGADGGAQADLGVRTVHAEEQFGQKYPSYGQRAAHAHVRLFLGGVRKRFKLVKRLHRFLRLYGKLPPEVGEHKPSADAVEQHDPVMFFQLGNGQAYGRLYGVQLLGGLCDAPLFAHGEKYAQMSDGHIGSL